MGELKYVGWFSDLSYGLPDAPVLRDSLYKLEQSITVKVAEYLDAGTVVAWCLMESDDELDPSGNTRIGSLNIISDGEYVWPSDLAYYVRTYRVELPNGFLQRMEGRQWRCPSLSPEDVDATTDKIWGPPEDQPIPII